MRKSKEPKAPRLPISKDPERLSKAAERVCALSDDRLCKQFLQDDRYTGPAYWMEPSGRRIDRSAAEELIRKHRFTPVRDGLFQEASSQTFERAS